MAGEAGRGRLVTATGAGLVDGGRASRSGELDAEGGGFGDQLLLNGGVGGQVGMAEHLAAVVVVAELGGAGGDGRIGVVGREGHRRGGGTSGGDGAGPADQSLVGMTMVECGWFGQVWALSIGRVGLVRHQTSDSTHYRKATGRRLWLARWLRIKDGDGHGMGGDEWEETE